MNLSFDLVDRIGMAGCSTIEAGWASEAISISEKRRDVGVFTDIQMPRSMDGISLARYVRKRWPPTIIVISSGKIVPDEGMLGCDMTFLEKPYGACKLDAVLTHVKSRLGNGD